MALTAIERQKFTQLAVSLGFNRKHAQRLMAVLDDAFARRPMLQAQLLAATKAGLDPEGRSLLQVVGIIVAVILALYIGPSLLAVMTARQALGLLLTALAVYVASQHPAEKARRWYDKLMRMLSAKVGGTDIGAIPRIKARLDRLTA